MASSNPTAQVKACLKDDAAYKANRKPIIQQIANGNKVYVTALVDTCKTVLKNKKEPAMSKFICLYFLKEAMDVKDPTLAEYVKDKILKRLCDIAKSSPSEVLGAKADSNIVKNFYQLLLEEIYFWSEWFGKDNKGKSTKYKTYLDDVAASVKMPQKAMFFKDRSKKSGEEKKSSDSQSKKPEPEQPTSDKRRPSITEKKKEEHKSSSSTSKTPDAGAGASSKNPSTKKMVQDLQVLNGQKDFMVAVLTGDENPDPETLGAIAEEIKDSDQRLQNHVNDVFNMPEFPEKEGLVNKLMEGNAFTSTYLQEYKRLQKGEINLAKFKATILQQTVNSNKESPEKSTPAAKTTNKREEIPAPPKKSKFNTAAPPEKRTDFEVNFASVNQPGASSSSPFDNFQSTPAQGRNSNAFDEFDSGARVQNNNDPNAFASFENPAARQDAFSAQNQFDNYNQSHPDSGQPQNNDAFNQFSSAPQAGGFDNQQNNFADFNTFQEAPKQRRFSNQPEDDFGRFDQYNKNLDPRPSQYQERQHAPPEITNTQEFHQEQALQANFEPKVELTGMAALRGERKKHDEEEEKTYQNQNQQQYDDGGFGMDAFDDFDTRNQPQDQETSGFDFDYGGPGAQKGTPHSAASHRGNMFDDPHGRRESFRKEFGQDDVFDTNFGQGIDENVRNSFNTNQRQQYEQQQQQYEQQQQQQQQQRYEQQQQHYEQQQQYEQHEPQTGAFGSFNDQQHKQQENAWANNAFDSFNQQQQAEPPAQQQASYSQRQNHQQEDFGRFDSGTKRTTLRGTYESPNQGAAPRETSMLNASQMVSNTRVQAKFGDMESERLRKERDRILSELENVKRMYSGMKIEYDYMKQNHDTTSTDYNKVRTELDDLRRHRGQLNFSNEQLRAENEAFKKYRGTLNNENENHLRLFEDMSKELSAIKQRVNEFDVDDQKLRNGSRLQELESSLRNAQLKVESMHNLQRTVHSEFNQVNNEFDRYRQNQFTESTFSPRRELFTSNTIHPVPASLDPNRSYHSPPRAYQSPPRDRSRSPQIVDLLSLERPHLATRTSPSRLRNSPPPLRSSYRAGDINMNIITPFDLMNNDIPPLSQPYGSGVQGLSEYKYSDPLTTSQLNRTASPPRYNSPPATSNFSNLIGFVPKYSDIPPINANDAITTNISSLNINKISSRDSTLNLPPFPSTSALNIQTTSTNNLAPYPTKYSSSAGLPPSDLSQPTGSFETLKRQGVSSTMTYSVAIPQQQTNSASKKAVDLIEKARRMREGMKSGTGSIIGNEPNYGARDSVHNRASVTSVNRNLAEDFIMPPPVIGNTNSMQQAGQFGGRLSPTRTRTSPTRISPRKSVSSPGRNGRPPVIEEFRGRTLGSTGEYGTNANTYTSTTNLVTELESQIASLPEGLYRGSPIRERVVNRSEMVELKPTETLRIVERVIGKSPSQRREKSPVPKGVKVSTTTTTDHHRRIFDPKPQGSQNLAQTLKSDFEMIKRSIDGGRYGIVSSSLNNPLEIAENFQQTTARRYDAPRGTSPSYVPDEQANASKMLRMYSQDQPISNKLTETLKRTQVRTEARNSATLFKDDLRIRTGSALADNYSSGKEVRQIGQAPGVRLTVEDNYFQTGGATNYHSRGFSQDINSNLHARNAAITDGLITQYNLTGKKIKPKNGKRIDFDHTLFDTFSNAVYGNPYFRDIDTFKNACLTSRSNLFETHLLQISSITRNESPVGPNDEILKVIIHYANKSLMDIVEFTAYPLEHSVQYVPQIQGGALTSKYQLKQEFFVSFFDLRNVPYIVNISYKQEGATKQMDVVLPITINKFMKFRHGIARNVFKDTWKQIKFGVTTTGYRNINSKFIRTHAELNKYFENNLIDISPQINDKNKKKYGGVFTLPDNKEYYLKITVDNSRLKVAVACGIGQGGYEEKIAQFLTFLFTV